MSRFTLGLLVAITPFLNTWSNAQESLQTGPLKQYVTAADEHYKWSVKNSGTADGVRWTQLHLVSQEWKGIVWKHVVWVVVPETGQPPAEHGLLYITGGGWKNDWPEDGAKLNPSGDTQQMALLAKATKCPVCVVQHVPFQPIFDGLVEDAIISKTFVEYLNSGDATWPLLVPMVKSAVRAMDACDAFMQQEHKTKLTKFTLFGASKRGWTTWLTSAIDPRVDAFAPIVIDVLNMGPQMKHQLATWGKYSEQIEDYSSKGIQQQMDTSGGKRLLQIVDPFEYRNQLTQTKLLIFGTNDPYWPVDACSLYWNELKGDNYLLYAPNQPHGIRDMERVLGSICALHRSRTGGPQLPKLKWEFEPTAENVSMQIECDQPTKNVRTWVARSNTKDFRQCQWEPVVMQASGKTFGSEVPRSEKYMALFGEVVIDHDPVDAYFSTSLQVFEPRK